MKKSKGKRSKGHDAARKKQTSPHGRSGRWVLIGICIFAVLAAGVALLTISGRGLRLSINGLAVTEDEYRRMLNTQIYQVSKELSEEYGLQSGGGFWEKDAGGVPAYQVLADRTVEALKRYRALYGIAQERGYVEDISYEALLKRVEAENEDRAEKIANGEPVYGLSSFTVDLFLEYEADAIRTRYCDDPASPGMEIPEAELQAEYEAGRETLFHRDDTLELTYLKIEYERLGLSAEDKNACLNDLEKLAGAPGNLSEQAAAMPELAPYVEQRTVTYADYRTASYEISDILSLADPLAAGERTAALDENGALYLVECTARADGGCVPYEEARDYLLKTMREAAFDELVAQRAEAAEVTGDWKRIYQFTKTAVQ